MDRRSFLRGAAGAGAVGALSMLPPSLVRAWAEPAPKGGLDSIEHVIVLMQENRSFDHYFGTMPGVRGYADLNALQLPTGRSVFHQPHGDGYLLPITTDLENHQGCDHTAGSAHIAYAEGRYDGWVQAKGTGGMVRYDRSSVEFYHQLAEAFTICDSYHCSTNGPTSPNRMFFVSGTNRNAFVMEDLEAYVGPFLFSNTPFKQWAWNTPREKVAEAVVAVLGDLVFPLLPDAVIDFLAGLADRGAPGPIFSRAALSHPDAAQQMEEAIYGLKWTSYAERLEAAGVSWKVYHEWDDYGDNYLEYMATYRDIGRKALKYTDDGGGYPYENTLSYYAALVSDPSLHAAGDAALQRGLAELTPAERSIAEKALVRSPSGKLVESFRADVESGKLPKVSWLALPEPMCEHPHWGPGNGQAMVHDLLAAISNNREVWNKTVFLINYDENDGYFDHVPPPVPPPGTADEYMYDMNIGLGSRVPLLVISPWTKQSVSSELFDHTSVLRFLERVTGVAEPNISAWRRKMCGDLSALFDFSAAAAPVLPVARPGTQKPSDDAAPQPVPDVQELPRQESGSKPRVPLPYRLGAQVRQNTAAGTVTVTMDNRGHAATYYRVHPNAFVEDYAPACFEVDPSGSIAHDCIAIDGRYDYTVYGIDGFQRRFAGDFAQPGHALEATVIAAISSVRKLDLSFTNSGSAPATFLIKANAYRSDGPWRITVAPGKTETKDMVLDKNSWGAGWYDLTVTTDIDPGFLRRYRGYAENGSRGVTADDAAPFNRLLMDRSMYESGRDPIVTYALATAPTAHRLAIFTDPGTDSGDVPATEALRTLDLPVGTMTDQIAMPTNLGAAPLDTGSAGPMAKVLPSGSTSGSGTPGTPLPSGTYVLHHLDAANKPLNQPVRFRVL